MKTWLIAAVVAAGMAAALVPDSSEARRLGGGRPAGMQRATPDKATQTPPAAPANQAAPNAANSPAAAAAPANAGAAAAGAAPKRSWLGPVAGLAAGLGLAALFSHLGLGEGLANFVMLALLAVAGVVALRWLVRRFAPQPAGKGAPLAMAGSGIGSAPAQRRVEPAWPASRPAAPPIVVPSGTVGAAGPALPADFDAAAFQRISKMIFIRMQAANDKADLNDLRAFTTPELYASLRLDLQERGQAAQQTDVVTLDAELLDFAQEDDRQIVSVRFHGLIREESHAGAEPFDEVWHLVRPRDGGGASWAIAGIQPRH